MVMKNGNGFTIVELLVVIVVIGILAAITIVSYTGISQTATVSSIQSDLDNASRQIKLYQVENGVYPVAIDCSFSPAANTICLKSSPGNIYDYYSDNTTNPQVFSLYATNSGSEVNYRITDNSKPTINNVISTSCLNILNSGSSTGNGIYWIKPVDTNISVYCDMVNGGWTRLNNNIATSTTPFGADDILVKNNVPGNCGTPGCAFTISNIAVAHTNVKILLTRTTSIIQCPSLEGVSGLSYKYWDGSAWISGGTCLWGNGIFANSTSTNMTGLKMLWRIEGVKAANGEIKFTSMCSGVDDSGQMRITAWVK